MGRKIGEHLLKLSINALIKQKLPLLGLSVTETNFSALRLYETLGFTVYDDFFEFIKPIRTN
jgi:ribosomal protein S18 acetylase RimI-like enzyme